MGYFGPRDKRARAPYIAIYRRVNSLLPLSPPFGQKAVALIPNLDYNASVPHENHSISNRTSQYGTVALSPEGAYNWTSTERKKQDV